MQGANLRRRVRRVGLRASCCALLVGVSAGPTVLLAQPPEPTATPDIPVASECTVAPVELTSLLNLAAGAQQPSNALSTEPASEESLPQGVPAIPEEVAGITATVRELVACANAADPLRIAALMTPELQASLVVTALTATPEQAQELMLRFPVPLTGVDPASPVAMIPIRDARLLPDGRVGAILEPLIPGTDQARVGFFTVFELVGDRWLVDDAMLLDEGLLLGTPAATPVATPNATPAST